MFSPTRPAGTAAVPAATPAPVAQPAAQPAPAAAPATSYAADAYGQQPLAAPGVASVASAGGGLLSRFFGFLGRLFSGLLNLFRAKPAAPVAPAAQTLPQAPAPVRSPVGAPPALGSPGWPGTPTTPAPAPVATQPAPTTPAPVTTPLTPVATTPTPVATPEPAPAPVAETPAPAPVAETPAPVTPTPAPVTTAPAPAPTTPAPVATTPTPAPVTPAPVTPAPVTPVPVATTPAPVTTTPAPVGTLPTAPPAPVTTTPAPVGTLPAPVAPPVTTLPPIDATPVTPAPVPPAPVTPAPVGATPTVLSPELLALAQQNGVLATPENMAAYMAEAQAIDAQAALGPGSADSSAVMELQQVLTGFGYPVTATGLFDDATAAAVLQFKRDNGLGATYRMADGTQAVHPFIDERTKQAMIAKLGGTPLVSTAPVIDATTVAQPTSAYQALPAAAPVTAEEAAIAQQAGILPTSANVQAFLAVANALELESDVIGPDSNLPDAVGELQQLLTMWGYPVGPAGQFDATTQASVLKFKRDNGLTETYQMADGSPGVHPFIDARTKAAIAAKLGSPS